MLRTNFEGGLELALSQLAVIMVHLILIGYQNINAIFLLATIMRMLSMKYTCLRRMKTELESLEWLGINKFL